MKKYYIWGFPGIGKSSVNSKSRTVDADCERFKFMIPEDIAGNPHSQKSMVFTQRDPSYPDNYFDYVRSVDADMVLLNCHISLLEKLDGENLLLVYPSAALKQEYLERYALRGDNADVKRFVALVRRYTEISELTYENVHEFIDRILIYELDKDTNTRKIEIFYSFAGKVDTGGTAHGKRSLFQADWR